jgi:hypothetical protein
MWTFATCILHQTLAQLDDKMKQWRKIYHMNGRRKNTFKDSIGENEGKREFGKSMCRLNDNIKLIPAEMRCHIKMILEEVL